MIMKKNVRLMSTTVGVVTFTSILLGAPVAFAGDGELIKPVTNPKSEAEISFSQDDEEITTPKEPGGGTVVEPDGTGMKGTLTIDLITKLNFGEQKISGNDKTHMAQLATLKMADQSIKRTPNYVQITDSRGSNAGWQLQVQQDYQFKAVDANNKVTSELTGAKLSFANPVMKSDKAAALAPTALGLTFQPNGAPATVVNSPANKGMGTWYYALGNSDEEGAKSVSLFIPGSTAKKIGAAYKTQLTWTIVNAPSASQGETPVTP